MTVRVLTLRQGGPCYEEILGQIRDDRELLAAAWSDAEMTLHEHPAKTWVVAVEGGRPLAWCALEPAPPDEGVALKAVDSYERRDARGRGLYTRVYIVRHDMIRRRSAVTYLFDQPVPLHLADGWQVTTDGWSNEPGIPAHHWTRLTWVANGRP
jgi:hypothetical protein